MPWESMGRLPGLALLLLIERIAPEEMCAAAGKRKEVALCAPAPSRCVRPKSVFWLYIRQVAGFSVGKGVLDALYPAKHIAWGDGYSLAHERTAKQLADAAAAGGVDVRVVPRLPLHARVLLRQHGRRRVPLRLIKAPRTPRRRPLCRGPTPQAAAGPRRAPQEPAPVDAPVS